MDEGRPPRPLIDDAEFLADLEQLDKRLPDRTQSASAPPPPRPLLELFPPVPTPQSGVPFPMSRAGTTVPNAPATQAGRSHHEQKNDFRRADTFYGFVEPPFSPDPDPRFSYRTTEQDRAAQQIVDAIARRTTPLVVVGPHGIGKTMLCSAVVQQLGGRVPVSCFTEPPPTADVVSSLAANAVVIVDDAQKASPELLRALVDAADSRQIVLVGSPALTSLLRHPALVAVDERAASRVQLGPLAADEIAGYVTHRVSIAGAASRLAFDGDAIGELFEVSHGVPRIVNQVCDRAIARAFESSAMTIDGAIVRAAAVDLGLAIPSRSRDWTAYAALALAFAAGAAAAGWIFRDRLIAILSRWPMFR